MARGFGGGMEQVVCLRSGDVPHQYPSRPVKELQRRGPRDSQTGHRVAGSTYMPGRRGFAA